MVRVVIGFYDCSDARTRIRVRVMFWGWFMFGFRCKYFKGAMVAGANVMEPIIIIIIVNILPTEVDLSVVF